LHPENVSFNGFNIKRFAHPSRRLFLGIHCYWLKRDAETFRELHVLKVLTTIFHKLKCRTSNELHLYIAEGNCFPSVYCANVLAQLTIQYSYILKWAATFPLKFAPFPRGPPEIAPKRHLDWFSRSCKAYERAQQTDRQTDHATQCVAIAGFI